MNNVQINGNDLYICACYAIPEGSARRHLNTGIFQRLIDDINTLEVNITDVKAFIMGDMNASTSTETDFVELDNDEYVTLPESYVVDANLNDTIGYRSSKDRHIVNENGHALLDVCKTTGYRIVNGRIGEDKNIGECTCVTHNGTSLVDYVLCKPEWFHHVCNFKVMKCTEFSDHNPLSINIVANFVNDKSKHLNRNRQHQQNAYYKWDITKQENLVYRFSQVNAVYDLNEAIDVHNDITCMIEAFTKVIRNICDPLLLVNKRPRSVKSTPARKCIKWMSIECQEKRKRFFITYNIYRCDKSDENRKAMVTARNEFRACSRKCRALYDKERSNRLFTAKVTDPKQFWKLLKENSTIKTQLHANDFLEHFKIVNGDNTHNIPLSEDVDQYISQYESGELDIIYHELNEDITEKEVRTAIKQLKAGKAAGHDLLLNEIYMKACDVLVPILTKLFRKILKEKFFPESWSEGVIIPLHKKGSVNETDNYRGITLLSTLGKLFTRILNNRLHAWAEKYEVIILSQFGFRKGYSTCFSIYVLHSIINLYITKKKKLYCAFIDFKKAFDRIDRSCLWLKLIKSGIRGNIIEVIRSMYQKTLARIRFEGNVTDTFESYFGVRQGECLSPFLFAIFLNDLEESLYNYGFKGIDLNGRNVITLLYADDAVLIADSKDELQLALNGINSYCSKWRMEINTSKTKVIVFRRSGIMKKDEEWFYAGERLDNVDAINYLGIVLKYTGVFNMTQRTLAAQARKAIFKLNRYTYGLVNVKPDLYSFLFDRLIQPILMYCAEVWGFNNAAAVERVHLQYCRKIFGLRKSTANHFVYGELSRYPLQLLRYVRILKFWLKCLSSTSLIRNAYLALLYEGNKNLIMSI